MKIVHKNLAKVLIRNWSRIGLFKRNEAYIDF